MARVALDSWKMGAMIGGLGQPTLVISLNGYVAEGATSTDNSDRSLQSKSRPVTGTKKTTRLRVAGEAGPSRARGDKDARSVGDSHSVRKQASTTTGADRRWPWRDTVVPLSLSLWVTCSSSGSQVARHTLRWPPVRCAGGLGFL